MNADPSEVVTIDGPAGSGKSSVARRLAQRLDWDCLDTGATYRCLCLVALNEDIPLDREDRLVERLKNLRITMSFEEGVVHVYADGKEVTDAIRTPRVSEHASEVAAHEAVRRIMVQKQRAMAANGSVVVEGRDIGTVVFPEARYKFYLDAELAERARRRYRQLREKGQTDVRKQEVLDDMRRRDDRDRGRSSSPLRAADDAVVVDTTTMSIQEVVDRLLRTIESA